MSLNKWTRQYYGVQHLHGLRGCWCSVTDFETFALLDMWHPGCGCNPLEKQFDTAEEARAAGEKWLVEQTR